MIETEHGEFELVKDESNIFNVLDFNKKFIPLLTKYEYIVGDYFQEILRLKGFHKEDAYRIPDYINEYCSLDSNYYILRNPKFNKNFNDEEESTNGN